MVDGPGVDAGVGPALLRTDSCGAAVSARFLVMLSGDVGGESLGEGCGRASVSVWRREGGGGRAVVVWEEGAREGEAGGVCVEARGRVFDGRASSRASSEAPLACKCRFLRKLKPRRPDGRGEGEVGERAVAATVGAAGAGAVNITGAVAKEDEDQPGRPRTLGGCVNRVSTTFDRQRSTDSLFIRPYALQYLYQGAEGHGGELREIANTRSGDAAKDAVRSSKLPLGQSGLRKYEAMARGPATIQRSARAKLYTVVDQRHGHSQVPVNGRR